MSEHVHEANNGHRPLDDPQPGRRPAGAEHSGEIAPAPPVERFLFTPPIDIYDSEEGLVLLADLPGVSIQTLELQVQDNKLTLFGRVMPPVPEGAQIRHQEYEVGDFLRSFILSDEVDHERISATMSNGVLKVVLPKAEKGQPRRIEVRTE